MKTIHTGIVLTWETYGALDSTRKKAVMREQVYWTVSDYLRILKTGVITPIEFLWFTTREELFDSQTLRTFLCNATQQTALLDGRTTWDIFTGVATRTGIEVARAYANGYATNQELDTANIAVCQSNYVNDPARFITKKSLSPSPISGHAFFACANLCSCVAYENMRSVPYLSGGDWAAAFSTGWTAMYNAWTSGWQFAGFSQASIMEPLLTGISFVNAS